MAVRLGRAQWKGDLASGSGLLFTETGVLDGAAYSASARFEDGQGTNPEELLGAAHAGCFAMALSLQLAQAGHPPDEVSVDAHVHIEKGDAGWSITRIRLVCEARVPGIDEAAFAERAEATKTGCPVSRALQAVPIELEARLVGQ